MTDLKETAEKEYYYLENEIGRYDLMCHGIKNWSITVNFAVLAAAFTQKVPELFLLSALAALIFWKTEARWKRIQRVHGVRIRAVEKYLNGELEEYKGPRIAENITSQFLQYGKTYWSRAWGVTKREFRTMAYGNVQLPHNMIFITGCTLFTLTWFDIIKM